MTDAKRRILVLWLAVAGVTASLLPGCQADEGSGPGRTRVVRPAALMGSVEVDFGAGAPPVLLDLRAATPEQLKAVQLRCPDGQLMRLDLWLKARSAELGRDLLDVASTLGYLLLSVPTEQPAQPAGGGSGAPAMPAGPAEPAPVPGSCDRELCGEACSGCHQECVICSDGLSVCFTSCPASAPPPAEECVVL